VTWVADNQPSARYPVYTRGNVGEVFPTVVSPLTWTVYGVEAEAGWRDGFCKFGAFSPEEFGDEPMVILGVFGGYCYLNMSLIRIFAVRTPGLSVADMDHQFFGEADAPPYVAQPGNRSLKHSAKVAATLVRTLRAKSLPMLEQDKIDVATWVAQLPAVATATDQQLLQIMWDFQPMFRRLFDHHIQITFQAQIGPGLLQQLVAGKLDDPGLIMTLLGGIGNVESAEPTTKLWELGRMVASEPKVWACFQVGLEGLADRLAYEPAAEPFLKGLDLFLHDFGSRGPNEWEGSSATWGTCPELALAAIDRMRLAGDDHHPQHHQAALAAARATATESVQRRLGMATRRQFATALRSSIVFSQGRERSKTTVIRGLHAVRLAQRELARRARDRGGPPALEDFWLLRKDEVTQYLADPPAWVETLAERAALRDQLTGLVPPFVFQGRQPPPEQWASSAVVAAPATAGVELQGIAGSPGVARGRARVVTDPLDPRGLGPGEVLVAPITDPSWTPLFVAAEAVIVDVGAQMSHAVIVARELGIPAVVSVTGATRRIPDGALVEVDGNAGVVRVLMSGAPEASEPSGAAPSSTG
jgi:pyruvate,water dikinase